MGLAGAPGGYSRAESASDPKESVCYDALFEGDSSKDVIKEIKTKCDKNGVLSKLDGSGGSGGKSMLLLELEAHIQKNYILCRLVFQVGDICKLKHHAAFYSASFIHKSYKMHVDMLFNI